MKLNIGPYHALFVMDAAHRMASAPATVPPLRSARCNSAGSGRGKVGQETSTLHDQGQLRPVVLLGAGLFRTMCMRAGGQI